MKKNTIRLFWPIQLFLLFFMSCPAMAQEPNWQPYAKLLNKYVTERNYQAGQLNWVNYSQLQRDPLYKQSISIIENFPVEKLKTRDERLAFYINAYNIFALKMVVENWPLNSIKQAGSFLSPVWKKKIGKIQGKRISLDTIEHKILRNMAEPRIHFAINCASISCPNLRKEPYQAKKLNQQLNEQTLEFLNDPYKGIKRTSHQIKISKIFDWFEGDFKKAGGVQGFITQYRQELRSTTIRGHLNYNWDLNGG